MNGLRGVIQLVSLALTPLLVMASDLEQEQVEHLQARGVLLNTAELAAQVQLLHPQAQLLEVAWEQAYGRYIYQVDLTDQQGRRWDVELDASTGEILSNYQDD